MKGNQLDLSSDAPQPAPAAAAAKPFIGVTFECCGFYARVYRNNAGDAYEGRCPKCARAIRFDIGPGGTSSRFFTAS